MTVYHIQIKHGIETDIPCKRQQVLKCLHFIAVFIIVQQNKTKVPNSHDWSDQGEFWYEYGLYTK